MLGLALAGAGLGLRISLLEARVAPVSPISQLALDTGRAAALPAGNGLPPTGTWVARGLVLSRLGGEDDPVGTRLTRSWIVFNRCTQGVCTPWLARQAPYGWERAPLTRSGSRYKALFTVLSRPCSVTGVAGLQRSFVISVEPSRRTMRAVEAVAGVYAGCGPNGGIGTHLQLRGLARRAQVADLRGGAAMPELDRHAGWAGRARRR